MNFASFRHQGQASWGVVEHDHVRLLATPAVPSLRSFIQADAAGRARVLASRASGQRLPLAALSWLPPIFEPTKIICLGVNCPSHAGETGRATPPHPGLFVRFADSQVGHLQPVQRPAESQAFDYEGELAVVIGQAASQVSVDDAMDCVFGYSCFAENSARDWQQHATQATAGKNFRRSGAFGPWITTGLAAQDLPSLVLNTRVNGEERQRDLLGRMIFSPARIIAYVSAFTDLAPGDVIVTGTPAGVGMGRTTPAFLQDGDEVEVTIAGIGTLRNRVQGSVA